MVLAVRAAEAAQDRPAAEYPLRAGTFTLGRGPDNPISFDHPTLSPRHASLTVSSDSMLVNDLNSENGVFYGDIRLPGFTVRVGESFRAGNVVCALLPSGRVGDRSLPARERRRVHEELLNRMDRGRAGLTGLSAVALEELTRKRITEILEEFYPGEGRAFFREVEDDVLGLGPLEPLLRDASVTEIMVNGPEKVYVEREGRLQPCGRAFLSAQHVRDVIERIVTPLGRRIDESSPIVDARLKDGSRVNAVLPPLALNGPTLTIRKFSKKKLTPEDLVRTGGASQEMMDYLKAAVRERKNIIISGGTGSGKTTLLNILSSFIPETERIVTIEDAAELSLGQEHVVSLEARPPNAEGRGEVTIRDLVKNALRMRPDRIVVGECRGGEALDMLQAMNTGHDGSLTTGHANRPGDMLRRLETMALFSGVELPLRAIREQVVAAVHLVVQVARAADGARRIVSVTALNGMEGESILLKELFRYDPGSRSFIRTA